VIRFCAAFVCRSRSFRRFPPISRRGLLSDVVDVSADFHDFTKAPTSWPTVSPHSTRRPAPVPSPGAATSSTRASPSIIWSPCSSRSTASPSPAANMPSIRRCLFHPVQSHAPRFAIRIKTGVVAGPKRHRRCWWASRRTTTPGRWRKWLAATATRASPARSPFSRTLGTSSFATPQGRRAHQDPAHFRLRHFARSRAAILLHPPPLRLLAQPGRRLSLSPDEKLFGCGESFTRLDKRGQKVVLWANDANGVESGRMYKPIPFFMSSRGYGMFVHTSAPATFDFGASLRLLEPTAVGRRCTRPVRLSRLAQGHPGRVHQHYRQGRHATAVVFRPVDEPHQLFFRSRSARRGRQAAPEPHPRPTSSISIPAGLRPTGAATTNSPKTRFPTPEKMIADLKRDGFHISLWQLPYFVPAEFAVPRRIPRPKAWP